jgi:hypothetical protein
LAVFFFRPVLLVIADCTSYFVMHFLDLYSPDTASLVKLGVSEEWSICHKWGRREMCNRFRLESVTRRNDMEYLGVDGRVLLHCNLQKRQGRFG